MNRRMESLYTSTEHFGCASDVRHIDTAETRVADGLCGAATRCELETEAGETFREIDEIGLVADAEKGEFS